LELSWWWLLAQCLLRQFIFYKMGVGMIEPTTPEEDEAFDNIERLSKIAQDLVRRQTELSQARNNVIEEVAQRFEKARDGCSPDDIMGRRWMDSAAELVRSMKK
jgi:hypothetical protein